MYADEQGKIVGKTRLQKMIFLYEKECQNKINQIREKNLFDFFAHHYGPFSKDLYKHLKNLKTFGMITIENETDSEDENLVEKETEYCITEDGITTVHEEIFQKERINPFEMETLDAFKKEYNSMNLNELIKLVYTKYPEYTKNSKIKEKVLG
ncbi:type II toxin-antitoxin system antitoxin SocA domain-containing protein [Sulfurimonas sp. HSL-1656]|uniref:type II toxin-antitoxin system antitoxin SocA domain-containing protein n=1 Tax=Thiomicrolovo subterrani TaxID=3131934 RepID=UPI0031F8B8CD